jgi:hypothetical protein
VAKREGRRDRAVVVQPVRFDGVVGVLLDEGRNVGDHEPVAHEARQVDVRDRDDGWSRRSAAGADDPREQQPWPERLHANPRSEVCATRCGGPGMNALAIVRMTPTLARQAVASSTSASGLSKIELAQMFDEERRQVLGREWPCIMNVDAW